ncbi:Tar ligand binding domain-containing protein [Duganella sp. FT3S]|uniref:Tar ligand binding domain-containing protein n=1 Tax=Rugamonas fusca TaxID=2758568 RepID=A0A7W2EIT2_9BURK|nr:methyl-accepting chemotaxis protein [Rugamonas fusca]MBA5606614.1 Tar ligand binding domain-containing protein [Rugamonas fusca]
MFNNLTIRLRLVFVIGFLSVLLVLGGVIGLVSLAGANDTLRNNYEQRMLPMSQLDQIVRLIDANQLAVAQALNEAPDVVQPEMAQVEQRMAQIARMWDTYVQNGLHPEEVALAHDYAEARQQFVAQGLRPAIEALRRDNHGAARTLMRGEMARLFVPVRKHIDALMALHLSSAHAEFEHSQLIYQRVRLACLTGIAFGLVLSAVIGVLLQRAIVRPLEQAVRVAGSVAAGDLTQRIAVETNDETGQLLQSLADMNTSLTKIVGDVRGGTAAINGAAHSIAAGNVELAERTEQQASALQQTAVSMEQLTVAVRENGASAQQANQLAQSAAQVANAGEAVVAKVVSTMGAINSSAARIGDIIGLIDRLAFQTNLLALNAAVEAARAGEHGKGFAVVANEVHQLAQQSAAAARQIKQLVQESQEQVAEGAELVDQAGATMHEILSSIGQVTAIIADISRAGAEQSAGIEQINQAVSQMDEGTRSNAVRVEEVAAAAQALQEQADGLSELVAVFKVDAPHTHHAQQQPCANVLPFERPARKGLAAQPAARSLRKPQGRPV